MKTKLSIALLLSLLLVGAAMAFNKPSARPAASKADCCCLSGDCACCLTGDCSCDGDCCCLSTDCCLTGDCCAGPAACCVASKVKAKGGCPSCDARHGICP